MNPAQDWKPGWQRWQATPEAALHVFCAGDAESGPTALITAGVHGDEYEGPAAIADLARELGRASLHGRVLLAPVVNPLARLTGTRITQEDGKNLARCFPGKVDGSVTERLACAVFEHLLLTSDFLIDPNDWSKANWHGFIPGHSFGQYVSGLARGYASTRDTATKEKVARLVEKFAATISTKFFDDYNLPAYTYDKLVVGLIDAYSLVGVIEARDALSKVTDAALPFLPDKALTREERRALPYKGVGELVAAPDCGMKYLPRASAEGKLRSMAGAAAILRAEL